MNEIENPKNEIDPKWGIGGEPGELGCNKKLVFGCGLREPGDFGLRNLAWKDFLGNPGPPHTKGHHKGIGRCLFINLFITL